MLPSHVASVSHVYVANCTKLSYTVLELKAYRQTHAGIMFA